jgi:hypothetical protein
VTTINPHPSTVAVGKTMPYTATVTDQNAAPITPTGKITWSDGGAGVALVLQHVHYQVLYVS